MVLPAESIISIFISILFFKNGEPPIKNVDLPCGISSGILVTLKYSDVPFSSMKTSMSLKPWYLFSLFIIGIENFPKCVL